MKLLAISDLHLGVATNRAALEVLPHHGDDWLIVGGDVAEKLEHVEHAWKLLTERFAKVIWTPGNHELWSTKENDIAYRGVAKYDALVELSRRYGVVTPEDPYPLWPGATGYVQGPVRIAPIFTLFDYSFRPDDVAEADAVQWAADTNVVSADEIYLRPDPFESRQAWCAARCEMTEERLRVASRDASLVIVGHFPLVREVVRLHAIERFSLWCGTTRTRHWHKRFQVACVVYGHLHIRSTEWRDGVRFEEVSLGMAKQWHHERGVEGYLREIFPGPMTAPADADVPPTFFR